MWRLLRGLAREKTDSNGLTYVLGGEATSIAGGAAGWRETGRSRLEWEDELCGREGAGENERGPAGVLEGKNT